jgi:Tol biopolymer transport system component
MLKNKKNICMFVFCLFFIIYLYGCEASNNKNNGNEGKRSVLHHEKYGIYMLDPVTQDLSLIYNTPDQISAMRINNQGNKFVFAQKIGGGTNQYTEICTIGIDGTNYKRLTNNTYWDLYPSWSSDDSRIAFITMRNQDLDIYIMNADGSNEYMFYDSGNHDADIHWTDSKIAFTSNNRIWTINDDGTNLKQITDPENAGQWGKANLPIGDYDPRFNSDGTKIVFERLEDPQSNHGDYNIFIINTDGTRETRLTSNGYAQGIANWSNSGDKLIYIIAAMRDKGMYDIFTINSDGTEITNITPEYFPDSFLCHSPVFSKDDLKVYFIGEWWSE